MASEPSITQAVERRIVHLSWSDVQTRLLRLGIINSVYGVPRGGMIAAGFVRGGTNVTDPADASVILDDIIDSGRTRDRYKERFPHKPFVALVNKLEGQDDPDAWYVFPWEDALDEQGPEDAVVRLLEYVGEDPKRDGLLATPKRVVRAWAEMTEGYRQDPAEILKVQFDEECDEMIVVNNIEFHSVCEHHMLPFHGTATVGYITKDGKVVGLSKIPRLVHCYAKRLQIQERLTQQITLAIQENLQPLGAGCIIRAHHTCCSMRGIKTQAQMITTSLKGVFLDVAKAEFLRFSPLQ